MKIVFGTGHRPDKLKGGWKNWENHYIELSEFCAAILEQENPDIVISGMALGWDFALAKAATKLNIPFHAYIPCKNQECKWPANSQKEYLHLLSLSRKKVTISEHYTNSCMQQRNIAMVDAASYGLALWNGTDGGTSNCIKYANSKKKEIINVWDIYNSLIMP